MRIRGWQVDGYGVFRQERVDDLPNGLTVVLGPNEAGKSTLLSFIRGVLFGFGTTADEPPHPPLAGGHWGGRLVLTDEDGTWIIERYVDGDAVTVIRPDGSTGIDDDLQWVLGNVDGPLFRNLFAFSLRELEEFSALGDDAVRDRIFSAGIVGAGRSARSVLAELEGERNALFSLESSDHTVGELREQLRSLNNELGVARREAVDHQRRRSELDVLADNMARIGAELEDSRSAIKRFEALVRIWDDHQRATDARTRLGALQHVPAAPVDAEARLERHLTEVANAERHVEEQRLRLVRLDDQLLLLSDNSELSEHSTEIRTLVEELSAERGRQERRAELTRTRQTQDTELSEELSALGPSWNRERLAAFDASIPAAEDVREWSRALDGASATIRQLESERHRVADLADHAARDTDRLSEQQTLYRDVPAVSDIDAAQHALRQLRNALAERDKTAQASAAAAQTAAAIERAPVVEPGGFSTVMSRLQPALLALAAILVAVTIASLVWFTSELAAVAGLGALIAGIGGFLAPTRTPERSQFDLDRRQTALTTVAEADQSIVELDGQISELQTRLQLDGATDPASLDRRESDIVAYRDASREAERITVALDDAVAIRDDASAHVARIDAQLVEARAHVTDVDTSWVAWKAHRQVSPTLSPEGVTDFFTTVKRARATLRRIELVEIEISSLDDRCRAFDERARRVLRRTASEPLTADLDVFAEIRRLHDQLRQNDEVTHDRELAEAERADLSRRALNADRELSVARAERDAFFAEMSAKDEPEFRELLALHHQRTELETVALHGEQVVRSAVGHGDSAKIAHAALEEGDVDGWERQRLDESTRLDRLQIEYEESIRRHQDASQALEAVASSTRIPELQIRREDLRRQLTGVVRDWRRLTYARGLILSTLEEFERDRQPAVLERARELFERVTDGRYQRLLLRDGSIELVDARGRHVDSANLSRGTAEQLYLCIRFGLAAERAEHTALPMVLDDVLVNFDPSRTRAMATVIAELASAHQILLFTCHPHIRDLFAELADDLRVIELPGPVH